MTLAGLNATLVGVGLARFAYTPLLPALIGAGWFAPAAAAYLGAATLAGYLAGRCWPAGSTRADRVLALRTMMTLATGAFSSHQLVSSMVSAAFAFLASAFAPLPTDPACATADRCLSFPHHNRCQAGGVAHVARHPSPAPALRGRSPRRRPRRAARRADAGRHP